MENGAVMAHIKGLARGQISFMPSSIDDYIDDDNPVRLIDAFVDSLDMLALNFIRAEPALTGTPGYDPKDMLKLYIYAYLNKIRSSRMIAKETTRNIEVMWLVGGLRPDFRTISDFRKVNAGALKSVFTEWNRACQKLGLFGGGYLSVDGSKFKGVNSKERNFTLSKLDDRIGRIDAYIEEYMDMLDAADAEEADTRKFSKTELEEKIAALKERKVDYETYRTEMEKTGQTQKSLTDPEARLMKFKEGFEVGYNIQSAIDSESQMVAGFLVTNHATDHGLLGEVVGGVRSDLGLDITESVADKGYQDTKDIMACLESGIIAHVHPRKTAGTFTIETPYEAADINEEDLASEDATDIKRCLRAGLVPDVLADVIEPLGVSAKAILEESTDDPQCDGQAMDTEQMLARAKEGYFVRDIPKDKVYCPAGQTLRRKSQRKDGAVRYANKLACKRCKHRCTKSKWKELDMAPGKKEAACPTYGGSIAVKPTRKKRAVSCKKVVIYSFKPDVKKLATRMSLSEHPFGTLKRWDNASYLLLKGKEKVTGELSLSFLTYNIRRAITLLGGVSELMEEMELKGKRMSAYC